MLPPSSLLACIITAAAAAATLGLRDPPLLGDGGPPTYLDGDAWIVSGGTTSVGAVVPGDVITDLFRGGAVHDPLFGTNWRDEAAAWAGPANWTYSRSFDVDEGTPLALAPSVLLVLDSMKMAADVALNGVVVSGAGVVDQHLRYAFEVAPVLRHGRNELRVVIPRPSADARNDEGRFMACSGGWDWSQYATTATPGGLPTLSFGIAKSVYLVPVAALSLRALVPLVVYDGAYPSTPLSDATAGPWTVNVTAHVVAGPRGAPGGALAVALAQFRGAAAVAPLAPGEARAVSVAIAVPTGAVRLWWPNGVAAPRGAPQPLYDVNATFTPDGGAAPTLVDARRIGFRAVALVTDDDTDPSRLANATGSGSLTTRLKVNGASIVARGSNVIPLDEFAGRADAGAAALHFASAAAAGMNTLLVWGGGVFPYEAALDAADELGLLLYQDLMYSAEGRAAHMVLDTPTQAAEIAAAVRRLASHPSVAIWAGGNEIGGGALYASFALTLVAAEDGSRPVWPASPSSGWATGVDRLWGHPLPPGREPLAVRLAPPPANASSTVQEGVYYMGFEGAAASARDAAECGRLCGATPGCVVANFAGSCLMRGFGFPVAAWGVPWCAAAWPPNASLPLPRPPAPCTVETHGPYTGGAGWPAVNSGGGDTPTPFDPQIPPTLPAPPGPPLGPAIAGTFTSEFGATSFSSFESMAPTLPPAAWGIHSPPMYWRSYSQDNFILTYFGAAAVNASAVGDAATISRQLLLSQLAAALLIKSELEALRATNTWGALLWQLGEIFPTGGWGSLEYASVATPGQVRGGRWKPLHYWLAETAFADLLIACGAAGQCYARNDAPLSGFTGVARLVLVSVRTGAATPLADAPISLPAGPAAIAWFCAGGGGGGCASWATVLTAAGCAPSGDDCVLNATLVDAAGAVVAVNPTLLATPAVLLPQLRPPVLTAALGPQPPEPGSPIRVTITVVAPALFVTLSSLAQGRFSRNAFTALPGAVDVYFLPLAGADDQYASLQATLTVQAL